MAVKKFLQETTNTRAYPEVNASGSLLWRLPGGSLVGISSVRDERGRKPDAHQVKAWLERERRAGRRPAPASSPQVAPEQAPSPRTPCAPAAAQQPSPQQAAATPPIGATQAPGVQSQQAGNTAATSAVPAEVAAGGGMTPGRLAGYVAVAVFGLAALGGLGLGGWWAYKSISSEEANVVATTETPPVDQQVHNENRQANDAWEPAPTWTFTERNRQTGETRETPVYDLDDFAGRPNCTPTDDVQVLNGRNVRRYECN